MGKCRQCSCKPLQKVAPSREEQAAAGDSLPVGSHQLASNSAKQCCNVFGRVRAVMALTADALREKAGCFYCAATLPTCAILFSMDETYFTERHNTGDTESFVKVFVRTFMAWLGKIKKKPV